MFGGFMFYTILIVCIFNYYGRQWLNVFSSSSSSSSFLFILLHYHQFFFFFLFSSSSFFFFISVLILLYTISPVQRICSTLTRTRFSRHTLSFMFFLHKSSCISQLTKKARGDVALFCALLRSTTL